jgi:hypothetical protein
MGWTYPVKKFGVGSIDDLRISKQMNNPPKKTIKYAIKSANIMIILFISPPF